MATNRELALKAWMVLVPLAAQRGTIQYGQLAELVGYRGVWANVGNFLEPIAAYCRAHELPALTTLVVAKDTGRPSRTEVHNVDAERERVYAINWHTILPTLLWEAEP